MHPDVQLVTELGDASLTLTGGGNAYIRTDGLILRNNKVYKGSVRAVWAADKERFVLGPYLPSWNEEQDWRKQVARTHVQKLSETLLDAANAYVAENPTALLDADVRKADDSVARAIEKVDTLKAALVEAQTELRGAQGARAVAKGALVRAETLQALQASGHLEIIKVGG